MLIRPTVEEQAILVHIDSGFAAIKQITPLEPKRKRKREEEEAEGLGRLDRDILRRKCVDLKKAASVTEYLTNQKVNAMTQEKKDLRKAMEQMQKERDEARAALAEATATQQVKTEENDGANPKATELTGGSEENSKDNVVFKEEEQEVTDVSLRNNIGVVVVTGNQIDEQPYAEARLVLGVTNENTAPGDMLYQRLPRIKKEESD
ncbi:hypothetical protein NX059_000369 [Plenodomus lindquistii]|nr:hypothetical protein NX059_000369 [Plenodomus lindquistii]